MQFPFFFRQAKLTKAPRRSRSSDGKIGRGFEQLEDRRMLSTIPVTLASDAASPVDDGEITLREAIQYVNGVTVPAADQTAFDFANLGTNDTIVFSTELADGLNGATITLTNGELLITRSVTIDASMLSDGITIDASGNDSKAIPVPGDGDGSRVLNIEFSSNLDTSVTLAGLTITGGDVPFGPFPSDSSGGGIRVAGDLDQNRSFSLSIRDSNISGNYASESGGGIAISASVPFFMAGTVVQIDISGSTIENNTAAGTSAPGLGSHAGGGGIFVDIDGNKENSGGAVFNLVDTTVSGNVATNGEGSRVFNFDFDGNGALNESRRVAPFALAV